MRDAIRFRFSLGLAAWSVLVAFASSVRAEDAAGTPPPPAVAAPTPAPCPDDAAAEAFWTKAMQWLGADRDDEGKLLLRDLARDYPDTPAGLRARQWLAEHGDRNHEGRAAFIIGSTLMGSYFGYTATLGIYDDVLSGTAWKTATWMSLGGGLVGLGASALASRWMDISSSQALLYNFAGTWGWLNGYLLYDLIRPLDGNEVLIAGATGMGLGLAASLALWRWLDVDEGAAQMSTSLGVFALEFAAVGGVIIGDWDVYRRNETAALLGVLVPANAAVVGGYFLGRKLKWSADDVRFISLGGFLGNLLGAAVIVSARPDSPRASAGILAASVVAGLAAGTLIVRPWQSPEQARRDDVPLTAGVVHLNTTGVHVRAPMPRIAPVEHRGRLGVGVDLPLLTSEL
jgi:hypothetical protein